MKKTLKRILVPVLLAVFIYSGLQVYDILGAYMRADRQYSELEQHVVQPEEKAPETQTSSAEPEAPPAWPQVDFEALAEVNPDVIGWLTIEGTNIHYPVVQGEDNDYYLSHQFDGSKNRVGCLFLDVKNAPDFSQENSIIYGHYTKDKSMFYELRGYKGQDFYDEHPTGWLVTPEAAYRLHFFSGYVSDVYGDGWELQFSKEDYAAWLKKRAAQSYFQSDVVPTADDRVLTLSTCSYEFDNARFVLHAVLEEMK